MEPPQLMAKTAAEKGLAPEAMFVLGHGCSIVLSVVADDEDTQGTEKQRLLLQ
jgi:hypothetical protein